MGKPESIKPNQHRVIVIMALFLVSIAGLWFWSNKSKQAAPSEMVWIPGGEFTMGELNPNEGHNEERPAHVVSVKGFSQ